MRSFSNVESIVVFCYIEISVFQYCCRTVQIATELAISLTFVLSDFLNNVSYVISNAMNKVDTFGRNFSRF
jgi:hypothetical protein